MISIDRVLTPPPVAKVVAVGAMELPGVKEPYDGLLERGLCHIVGFEGIAAECERLNRGARPGARYFPHLIGDGAERDFHVTNVPMTSSLYPPNSDLLRQFNYLDELTRVVETHRVRTIRLDDVAEAEDTDYLKIDVQGAELDVLNGGPRTLDAAVVVHIEVDFVPLYAGQALFGDVDVELRRHGFLLHRFHEIAGRAFWPLVADNDVNKALSQSLWADAVYVKDFMRLDRLASRKRLVLSMILNEVYRSVDMCAHVLRVHDRIEGTDYWRRYLKELTGREPDGLAPPGA